MSSAYRSGFAGSALHAIGMTLSVWMVPGLRQQHRRIEILPKQWPDIPPKANRKNPPPCDFKAYKDRNRIERMFNRLKQFRRIATRFDKTVKSFAAFLALAAAKIWMPHFVIRT